MGTYLKAPNGKPTNLTPKQWVQVRTKAFKRWFGDWELPFKRVQNVEISNYPNSRNEALSYLSTLTQPFRNDDQQVEIYVSNRDARHTMQYRNADQIRVIGGIEEVIKKAVYVCDVKVDEDEVKTVKAVHIYYCPVLINGKQYSARMVVKEYFKGSHVIDELHLYNVMLKKQHQTNTLSQDGTPRMRSSALKHYKVSDLIHNEQELSQISSKIVDANGEPRVVYHGGSFAIDEFVPIGSMHFGTKVAALQRVLDKEWGYDNWRTIRNADNTWSWEYIDPDGWGYDKRSARSFSTPTEALEDAVNSFDGEYSIEAIR